MTRTIHGLALLTLLGAALPIFAQDNPEAAAQLAEDERTLQARKIPTDGPGLLDYFRHRTPSAADEAQTRKWIGLLGDAAFPVREAASRQLIERGPAALAELRRALEDPDLEVQRRAAHCIDAIQSQASAAVDGAAVRVLLARRPAETVAVLLGYLPVVDDEGVEDEIRSALITLGARAGQVDPALVAALTDPAPARRAHAALIVGRYGTADQQARVRALLADRDLKVRFLAAQGLLAGRDKAAGPVLIDVLGEGPMELAWQAEEWLRRVAGGQDPPGPLGETSTARRQARAAWESWWKAHAAKVDLAKADVELVTANPVQQAKEATRRFLSALLKNDAAALRRATDVPFSLLGLENFTNRDELAKFFAKTERGEKFTYQVQGVVGLDQYLAKAPEKEKTFYAKFFKVPLRVVYIQVFEKGQNRPENLAIFVKTSGPRPAVVGIGETPGAK